jgi:UDP-N-acetylglucosamine 2-epimerase (non-hydrolysing)
MELKTTKNISKMVVHLIAAARPNFMKIAPLYHALRKEDWAVPRIVHTGQHYDLNMSDAFFQDLDLPEPHLHLGVGSGTHAKQTGLVMIEYEKILSETEPDIVVVVGDVNSTVAATLAAAKLGVKVAHLEAGLRSFDRTMPEEINRVVTDSLADFLWTPSPDADENLLREGIPVNKIKRVGNIMIDTLINNLDRARKKHSFTQFGLKENNYVFVTLHRPSNVDNNFSLSSIIECLIGLSRDFPVILPVHPRTKKQLISFGLWERANSIPHFILTEPLSYLDSINLVENARFVLTDSGGLQEETTFLKVPCLTLRPNTERPITITQGTNKLTSLETMEKDIALILNGNNKNGKIPELWDGRVGERIVKILLQQAS